MQGLRRPYPTVLLAAVDAANTLLCTVRLAVADCARYVTLLMPGSPGLRGVSRCPSQMFSMSDICHIIPRVHVPLCEHPAKVLWRGCALLGEYYATMSRTSMPLQVGEMVGRCDLAREELKPIYTPMHASVSTANARASCQLAVELIETPLRTRAARDPSLAEAGNQDDLASYPNSPDRHLS